MPVLITILAVLSGVAFWYYRMRDVGRVAHEVHDGAQQVRGAYRRKQFRAKAESSPFAAVDDPAAAATAMLVALANPDGRLTTAMEQAIKEEMHRVMASDNVEETFTFGCWVAGQVNDPNDLSLKFAKLWTSALTTSERFDLYGMATRVVAAGGAPTDLQKGALLRLKDRLGLTRL